jgi:hypothetical protein
MTGRGRARLPATRRLAAEQVERFDEELAKALRRCDVLIAVIGEHWMELLKAKTANGERDHVREEIAAALQRCRRSPAPRICPPTSVT